MNLDLEKVMMTKTDPHPAAFATRQTIQQNSWQELACCATAKAAYIFYNTEHSVPGQYSHFSSFALAFQVLVGSCFQPLLPSTDFKTNWTKFPVIFLFFLDTHRISTKHLDHFGPLRHPLPSDNCKGASPGASLILSTWSRRRSGGWGCFSSASSTLWRQRSGDVQKPYELLRNSEKDLRRSWCGYVWISISWNVCKKNEFRCNGC